MPRGGPDAHADRDAGADRLVDAPPARPRASVIGVLGEPGADGAGSGDHVVDGAAYADGDLRLVDAIHIQTREAWYTYRFRDLEYVTPQTSEVLAAVPHRPELAPTDRIVTLTSRNPLYSTAERIVAYGVLESWQPTSAGPPAEIAAEVAAWGT